MVMHGVHGLPLVGIVEFIMYGCIKYFMDHYKAASLSMSNPSLVFGERTTEYLDNKIRKARQHNVVWMGKMELRFEVACKDRSRRGVCGERVVQECMLRDDGTTACMCHKPKLLHRPCSHVIDACVESEIKLRTFIFEYFTKEAILSIWSHEVYGVRMLGSFTGKNAQTWYIPDPSAKMNASPGQWKTRHIWGVYGWGWGR
jgi:hypothetical protein